MPQVPVFESRESLPRSAGLAPLDPGVAGAGAAALGGLAEAGSDIALEVIERTQRQADAAALTEATRRFLRGSRDELTRRAREADPAAPGFTTEFTTFLDEQREAIVEAAGARASREALTQLDGRLTSASESFRDQALRLQERAVEEEAALSFAQASNDLAAELSRGMPLDAALGMVEQMDADFAGALSPQARAVAVADARSLAIESHVGHLLAQGRTGAARAVLADERFDEDLDAAARARLGRGLEAARRRAETRIKDEAADYLFLLGQGRERDPEAEARFTAVGGDFAERFADRADFFAELGRVGDAARTASDAEIAAFLERNRPDPNAAGVTRQDFEDFRATADLLGDLAARRRDDPAGFFAAEADAGVRALIEQGALSDPAAIEDPALRRQAEIEVERARVGLVREMARDAGVPFVPFAQDEIAARARGLAAAGPEEAVKELDRIHDAAGDAGVAQLAGALKGDRPHLAMAARLGAAGPGGRATAARIVDGARLLAENKDLKPGKEARDDAAAAFETVFADAPELRAPAMAAADALYAGVAVAGEPDDPAAAYERAIRRALGALEDAGGDLAGGPFAFQGRQILPPPGVSEARFRAAWESMEIDDLARFGLVAGPGGVRPLARGAAPVAADGTPITMAEIRRDGVLRSVDMGVYMIELGDGGVGATAADGGVGMYLLDMSRALPRALARAEALSALDDSAEVEGFQRLADERRSEEARAALDRSSLIIGAGARAEREAEFRRRREESDAAEAAELFRFGIEQPEGGAGGESGE